MGKRQPAIQSIFQDDAKLVYARPGRVAKTIKLLRALGVDDLRITVRWLDVAPDVTSPTRPPGFDATNPAAYPPSSWAPYDRVVKLARANGLYVDFNVTAPGPAWAMQPGAPNATDASHFVPSPAAYGEFMTALGRRYSGTYLPEGSRSTLPRVNFWTIWNEPNQPGWLLPQWTSIGGQLVMAAPTLYRALVDAGYGALTATGHRKDTILIGELAPEGRELPGIAAPIPPMPFLRALYCVGAGYQPLLGQRATTIGCPANGNPAQFVKAHPGLFNVSGFAHHPYSFFLAPSVAVSDRNFVPLANLGRLEDALDSIFMTYDPNVSLPVYLTEYGYETNPPNPYRGVSLRQQSEYLNQAQFLAFQDLRVRSLAQFLLVDSPPDTRYRRGSVRYWSTFQTGLEFLGGRAKPSLNSYRLPIYLPRSTARPGTRTLVWGMLRLAPNGTRQRAQIQWRPLGGEYRTLTTASTTNPVGFISAQVRLPASGSVRIVWTSSGGQVFHSRSVGVTVG